MAKKQTKTPSPAAEPSMKKMDGGPDDYEAESAFSTLTRASEYLADEDMMKRVKKHAGRKHKAIMGLHNMLKEPMGEEKEDTKGVRSIEDLRKVAGMKAKTGMRNMG